MENSNQPHAAPSTPADSPEGNKHFVTEGERLFDKRTYNDIGYKVNVASSIAMVYGAERTNWGRELLTRCAEGIARSFKFNPKTVHYFLTKTMFLSGGFLVMLPMKWMEDKKLEWVHKKNLEIYGPAADDPQIIQSEKEIADAPKQGWASLISARALALTGFYTLMGVFWDNKSRISRWTNSAFKGLNKTALDAKEAVNLSEFANEASKGMYIDRAVVAASRWLGKGWSKITGNTQAVAKTEEMASKYPGMMKQGAVTNADRDTTASSLFYYTISEMITSKFVAVWVYLISRVTGPFFGDKTKPESAKTYGRDFSKQQFSEETTQQLVRAYSPAVKVSEALHDGSISAPTSSRAV